MRGRQDGHKRSPPPSHGYRPPCSCEAHASSLHRFLNRPHPPRLAPHPISIRPRACRRDHSSRAPSPTPFVVPIRRTTSNQPPTVTASSYSIRSDSNYNINQPPACSGTAPATAMMEPRHAPPSRYKTVRRKPSVTTAAVAAPVQAAPPSPQEKTRPALQTTPRPLIDLAASSSRPDQLEHHVEDHQQPQLKRRKSKLRQILCLNTSTNDHTSPAPRSAPVRDRDQYRKLVKSPERSEVRSAGDEDGEGKHRAREDAIAALEGKKKRRSKPKGPLDDTVRLDTLHFRCVVGGKDEEAAYTSAAAVARKHNHLVNQPLLTNSRVLFPLFSGLRSQNPTPPPKVRPNHSPDTPQHRCRNASAESTPRPRTMFDGMLAEPRHPAPGSLLRASVGCCKHLGRRRHAAPAVGQERVGRIHGQTRGFPEG